MRDPRLDRLESSLNDFERGEIDVMRLQSAVDAVAATLDNSTPEMLRELQSLEAALEGIRFTVQDEEQRGEALTRLEQTREILRRCLASP